MYDILLIEMMLNFLESIKEYLKGVFQKKDLDEAAYILVIKIYKDRSRRLIRLSMSTYLDFEGVQNGSVKEGVLA